MQLLFPDHAILWVKVERLSFAERMRRPRVTIRLDTFMLTAIDKETDRLRDLHTCVVESKAERYQPLPRIANMVKVGSRKGRAGKRFQVPATCHSLVLSDQLAEHWECETATSTSCTQARYYVSLNNICASRDCDKLACFLPKQVADDMKHDAYYRLPYHWLRTFLHDWPTQQTASGGRNICTTLLH
jgi:hypothetical protein